MSFAVRIVVSVTTALALLAGCSGAPPPAAPPTSDSPTTGQQTTAQQTVDQFVRSLLEQDRAAFEALVSDHDPAFAPTATMLFDNLRSLKPTHFALTLTGQQAELGDDRQDVLGAGAVAWEARLEWQVPGDAAPADHLVTVTLVPGPDGPLIAGTTDAPQARQPLWWFAPIRTAHDGQVTVIGSADVEVDVWLQRATRAARSVVHEREGAPALVLVVPGNSSALERVLGRPMGEQLGALAFADGSDAATAPCRVVLNPESVDGIGAPALDFLLTHEAVHAATLSPRSPSPLWVVEGYADLVASRAHPDVQDAAVAALLAQVRRAGPPSALPDNVAFGADADDLSRTYAEALFAFRYLVDTHSPATATSFYDRLETEFHGDLDRAMPAILQQTPAEFTSGWQAYLERRAR